MTVEYELKSTNDLERLLAVFKRVNWVVPCVYRKLKLGRSGGAVRQGCRVI
jgi:hypothetical protein